MRLPIELSSTTDVVSQTDTHITNSIGSKIIINGQAQTIWDNITNVKIEKFWEPFIFKLLNIPKPLSAEIISEGEGGSRIAYFDTGKNLFKRF